MIGAIFYKEWLKTRWFSLAILAVFILFLIQIELLTGYNIRQYGSESFWYNLIYKKLLFYNGIKYLPVFSAIVFGLAQFVPEVLSKKLKLTLHLPLNEQKILLSMILFGMISLLLIDIIVMIGLMIIVLGFFPVELWTSVFWTTLPWFWAGIVAYWVVAMVAIEPHWIKRGLFVLVGYSFFDTLFISRGYNLYEESIWLFIICGLTLSLGIFYTGERFRRGVS